MRAIILALVASLVLIGCSSAPGGAVNNVDQPSAGSIWFGTAYDPTTFALSGRTSSVNVGSQVALVAGIRPLAADERVSIQLTGAGGQFTAGYGDLSAGSTVVAFLIAPIWIDTPGRLSVAVIDQGGNVLATSALTILT